MSTADGIPSPPSVSVDTASRPKSNGDRHEMEKCVGLKQPTQPQPEMAPAAAEASVLAQAAETLQKQQQAAAAVAAAQYQLDQKKGSSGVAVGPVMPQGQTTVEENGSGAAADQAARRPIAGQVRTNQPLHKDNSGEWVNLTFNRKHSYQLELLWFCIVCLLIPLPGNILFSQTTRHA